MDNLSTDTIHVDNATLVRAVITTFIEGFESASGVAIGTSVNDVWVPSKAIEETQDLNGRVREGEFIDTVLKRQTKARIRDIWFRNISVPGAILPMGSLSTPISLIGMDGWRPGCFIEGGR